MCLSPIKNYSLLKKETDLREKNSLYIPDHALDNVKKHDSMEI